MNITFPKPAILLVDDDPRALLATEGHLQSDTYDILTVRSGAEALRRLREPREFALVLLDVRMPVMDGFAVAHAMKAEARLALIPICFLTASVKEQDDILHGYEVGAADLLTKPVDPYLLRAKVTVFVNLWRTTRELAASNQKLTEEIDERKRAEEALQAALRAKDLLLKEVHHRVKNNMQVISSLLSLQAGTLPDPRLAEPFRECRSRIQSMALVHEKLYRSGNFDTIALHEYLRELSGMLWHAHRPAGDARIDLAFDPVTVRLDAAIPLGLIANELIINSIKYAFGNGKGHLFSVRLKTEGDSACIEFRDDGPGMPEGFDLQKSTTLGLKLVRMLTEQINGQVEFKSGPDGTCVTIRWPNTPATETFVASLASTQTPIATAA